MSLRIKDGGLVSDSGDFCLTSVCCLVDVALLSIEAFIGVGDTFPLFLGDACTLLCLLGANLSTNLEKWDLVLLLSLRTKDGGLVGSESGDLCVCCLVDVALPSIETFIDLGDTVPPFLGGLVESESGDLCVCCLVDVALPSIEDETFIDLGDTVPPFLGDICTLLYLLMVDVSCNFDCDLVLLLSLCIKRGFVRESGETELRSPALGLA